MRWKIWARLARGWTRTKNMRIIRRTKLKKRKSKNQHGLILWPSFQIIKNVKVKWRCIYVSKVVICSTCLFSCLNICPKEYVLRFIPIFKIRRRLKLQNQEKKICWSIQAGKFGENLTGKLENIHLYRSLLWNDHFKAFCNLNSQ